MMLRLLVILAVAGATLASPKERLVKKQAASKYKVIRGSMNWREAQTACEDIGYSLAEIRSKEDTYEAKQFHDEDILWIGITDISHEGTFTYWRGDAALTYLNWAPGEPNNLDDEDCVHLWADGTWNDHDCVTTKGDALCEHFDADIHGDPHMTTFDGHAYTFQGTCWYTMFKDCSPNPGFEVTTKFEPREDSTPEQVRTRIVSFNVTVGDQYAIVDGLDIVTGRTHGQLTAAKAIHIEEEEKKIRLHFSLKDTTFTLDWTLRKHILSASFTGSDYHGKLCGLMGNADGDPLNDFQKPDGSVLNHVDVADFGDSWKIKSKKCD
uniref:IgGFc-binding protein-like n=1 Tax=Saccoglossus kowalevskii TaxID=10224 RepID=A0ABM0GN14_SACKO|nr:PREDICTED: IgGFc-binding protein-like [Saccoglossus kowalevskii]